MRVWYQNQQLLFPTKELRLSSSSEITFSYIYLPHPRTVTGFSWRKTSKFMPRCGFKLSFIEMKRLTR